MIMYTPSSEVKLSLFRTPFEQELDANNRWVKMAEVVPWDEMAGVFYTRMSKDQGRASVDLRVVLGAYWSSMWKGSRTRIRSSTSKRTSTLSIS